MGVTSLVMMATKTVVVSLMTVILIGGNKDDVLGGNKDDVPGESGEGHLD